jgi:hypothetical protein
MKPIYDWAWVENQVTRAMDVWNGSRSSWPQGGRLFSPKEQQQREKAYDEELQAVEQEARRAPRSKTERIEMHNRLVASFARFSATALDLDGETIKILTDEFLPVGTKLARWARCFDGDLSMTDIIQACRNAWTACGLQPLLGAAVGLTPSILGYSLLYPYSDNYLDHEEISTEAKLHFSERFRCLLRGEDLFATNPRETALRTLIGLIEGQYPRARYPHVYDCLLAIHRAQEHSLRLQLTGWSLCGDDADVLRVSCGKGGSSVLADACLAYGQLSEEESRFAFEWGVLLQLGDDLQDVREDMRQGSATLFSRAVASGKPLDELAIQLLSFSDAVGARMDRLPNGAAILKELLKKSWRSLIIGAVADSHDFFSAAFLAQAERFSPFRFRFLLARQKRLVRQQGLYAMLFEAFLDAREDDTNESQLPVQTLGSVRTGANLAAIADLPD